MDQRAKQQAAHDAGNYGAAAWCFCAPCAGGSVRDGWAPGDTLLHWAVRTGRARDVVAVLVALLPLCRAACECTYTNTDLECPTIGPEGNKTVGCELGVRRLYLLFFSTASQAC